MEKTNYWKKADENKKKAVEHTEYMEKKYSNEIKECIENTKTYSPSFQIIGREINRKPNIIICESDSVSATFKYYDKKTCVLNFASFKNPGGKFMEGSSAQEESLCHESFLYNVLREKQKYYDWNELNKNKALYVNRALYSPDVIFEHDGIAKRIDVITCAAPNLTAAQKYNNIGVMENRDTFRSRIAFVSDILYEQEVRTVILGAWGCGVFGQDAYEIGKLFKEAIEQNRLTVETIVFAIPAGPNLEGFRAAFSRK